MQKFSRWLAVASLAAGVLCLVPVAGAQEKGSLLIVPGKSVGEISLDMTTREVHRKLGKPTAPAAIGSGGTWESWLAKPGGGGNSELDVHFERSDGHEKEGRVTAIRLDSLFFHTKEGISRQSRLADLWEAFPNLRYIHTDDVDHRIEVYADASRGIGIEVCRTSTGSGPLPASAMAWGICQGIIVFAPNNPAGADTSAISR